VIGGAAVVARLTHDRLGPASLTCLAAALPLGLLVLVEGRSRYARRSPRGGRAPAAVAAATLALALVETAALLG
jgi:hypothetical protein